MHGSSVPKVVGIMALVFAPIGLGLAVLFGVPAAGRHYGPDWDAAQLWARLWLGISVLLFLLHLVGGILALMYKKLGLRLLTAYAIAAIVLVIVDLVMIKYTPSDRAHDRHGWGVIARFFGNLFLLPWPVVVVTLVNLPRTRSACR